MPERIAVIGGGVSGLAALWALNLQGHEVHIFESSDQLGGHAHSFPWQNATEEGGITMVDTAFVLFNEETYRESGGNRQEAVADQDFSELYFVSFPPLFVFKSDS